MFKDYPEGVRFVEFRHGGEDTKNWAGHFGVKLARSGVHVAQKRSRRARRVSSIVLYMYFHNTFCITASEICR